MELKGKHIGLAITGSFCTFAKIEQEILKLKEEAMVLREKDFSLYRFHQFLLEKGPADFQSLREMLPLYAAS